MTKANPRGNKLGINNDIRGTLVKLSSISAPITKPHFAIMQKDPDLNPFSINTLTNSTTRKLLQQKSISHRMSSITIAKDRHSEMKQKNDLITSYKVNYGITFKSKEISKIISQVDLVGLNVILQKKLGEKKQEIAATTIQSAYRGYLMRKWYNEYHGYRVQAANRIKLFWKHHYLHTIVPRNYLLQNMDAVKHVQSVCKGYLARQKCLRMQKGENEWNIRKIDNTYDFFEEKKKELQNEMWYVLVYYAKKFMKNEQNKRLKKPKAEKRSL